MQEIKVTIRNTRERGQVIRVAAPFPVHVPFSPAFAEGATPDARFVVPEGLDIPIGNPEFFGDAKNIAYGVPRDVPCLCNLPHGKMCGSKLQYELHWNFSGHSMASLL